MKKVLVIAAVSEAATGLALLVRVWLRHRQKEN